MIFNTILEKPFWVLWGHEGSGKTVLLKQLAAAHEGAFYFSLDSVATLDLFKLAEHLVRSYRIKLLLLDEVHHYPRSVCGSKKNLRLSPGSGHFYKFCSTPNAGDIL